MSTTERPPEGRRHEQLRAALNDASARRTLLGSDPPIPALASDWLSSLQQLSVVPFHHLVPDARMLPPESIRFFFVDPNWISALIDGAISVATTEPAVAATAALRPRLTSMAGPWSGILLRSALVADLPGLTVTGYSDAAGTTPLTVVARRLPSPSVLLVLFAGGLERLEITEPAQHLHFGVIPSPAGSAPTVALRFIDPDRAGQQPTGDPEVGIALRPDATRSVLDPTQTAANIAAGLQHAYAAVAGTCPPVNSAAVALQLIQTTRQQDFLIQPPAPGRRVGAIMNRPRSAPVATPALLVPISVDTLLLTTKSYLPGAVTWSWTAPNYRFLEQALPAAPQRFVNVPPAPTAAGNGAAFTGAVVKWSLPDALTRGTTVDADDGSTQFPAIPNRWLVHRTVAGQPAATSDWIVAADVLGAGSNFYDQGRAVGLGRVWTLADWPGEIGVGAVLDPPLTAVGTGDATFAAFAPGLTDILSFADPLIGVPAGSPLAYTVIGWYASAGADPLAPVAALSTPTDWAAFAGDLDWSVGDADDLDVAVAAAGEWAAATGAPGPIGALPARTVYHGTCCGVQWMGPDPATIQSGVPTPAADDAATEVGLVVAHSGVDALATAIGADLGQVDSFDEVLQALANDLVPVLDQLDGPDQLALTVQSSWFAQSDGGTVWRLQRADGNDLAPSGTDPALSPTEMTALDTLNAAQRTLDTQARALSSDQAQVYDLWWKRTYSSAYGVDPSVQAQIDQAFAAVTAATDTAITAVRDLSAQRDTARQALVASIGSDLELVASARPAFWQPNDPVALIHGVGRAWTHGFDGRFTSDGTLFCRFSGQTLDALAVPAPGGTVTGAQLTLPAVSVTDGPVEIADLLAEAVFVDPDYAGTIAAIAVGQPAPPADLVGAVAAQQTVIWNTVLDPSLDQQSIAEAAGLAGRFGPVRVCSKVAVEYWAPPWSPLHLDWLVTYYPTPGGYSGWTFPAPGAGGLDRQTAGWVGPPPTNGYQLSGRTLLTPQAPLAFAQRLRQLGQSGDPTIADYLPDINDAVQYLTGAGVLSQTLSGLNDQLRQHNPAQRQAPPTGDAADSLDAWLRPVGLPPFVPEGAPVPDSPIPFTGLRNGCLSVDKLWVVDDFGQVYDVGANMDKYRPGGPQLGPDFSPAPVVGAQVAQMKCLLKPRILQPSRLTLDFLDADTDVPVLDHSAADPICGWLVPNGLDRSILVHDAAGTLIGELLLVTTPAGPSTPDGSTVVWSPAPDVARPDSGDLPLTLNGHLRDLLARLTNNALALPELFAAIDASTWSTETTGIFRAGLIGTPIALVRAALTLELAGAAATDQSWTASGQQQTGQLGAASFPVLLGSSELYDDGLIGYASDDAPDQLRSPYATSGGTFVIESPIDIGLGQSLPLTVLVHPRTRIHAFSSILPPTRTALPTGAQSPPADLEVTIRCGPLLTPGTELQAPRPTGNWAFLAYDGGTDPAQSVAVAPPDVGAPLPDLDPVLRDGWLRTSSAVTPTALGYSLAPTVVPAGATGLGLTVAAYNSTGQPVQCTGIRISLPIGTDVTDLAATADQAVATTDVQGWQCVADPAVDGRFLASPVDPSVPIPTGGTIEVALTGLTTSPAAGPVFLDVMETVGGHTTSTTLRLEKIPAGARNDHPEPASARPDTANGIVR